MALHAMSASPVHHVQRRCRRMTDKVLCPWCGSEMWHPDSPWKRQQPEMGGYMYKMHGKCRHCEAMTPAAYGRTPEEAMNAFFAAALRRYEPPCRPLTPEEIDPEKYQNLFIEYRNNSCSGWECASYLRSGTFLYGDTYGKTWRCWPRKPTEAERKAAGWEDAE